MEGILQIAFYYKKKVWLWDQEEYKVGYTVTVNDRRHYSLNPKFLDLKQGINIDDFGFRYVDNKNADLYIINLGDSVPFGVGVKDNETYPSKLNDLFKKKLEPKIRVVNAGVPSYTIRQSFDRLKIDVISKYSPKKILAITIQAANDISLLTHYQSAWTEDVTWASVRYSLNWSKPTKIATKFFIQKAVASRNNTAEHHAHFNGDKMILALRSNLKTISEFAEQNKIPIILMPIDPFYFSMNERKKDNEKLSNWERNKNIVEIWQSLIDQFNLELMQVSSKNKYIYFLDSREIIDKNNREKSYIDFIHYSEFGNEVIANELYRYINLYLLK